MMLIWRYDKNEALKEYAIGLTEVKSLGDFKNINILSLCLFFFKFYFIEFIILIHFVILQIDSKIWCILYLEMAHFKYIYQKLEFKMGHL